MQLAVLAIPWRWRGHCAFKYLSHPIAKMNVPRNDRSKGNIGLFISAIVLLLSGGVALVMGSNDVAVRSLAMLAIVISVYCVRLSNISTRSDSANTIIQQTRSKLPTRPSRSIWIVSIMLLPLLGLSFVWLYSDAAHGYHQIWPVYFFTGTAIACTLCWSYLVARLLGAR